MKKSLYLTSALVAASVLALGSTDTMAGSHSKAKKMSMGISGSYKAMVGFSTQTEGFEVVGTGTTASDYTEFDVKTDSEIHFKGSTKTDSGLAIGVAVELETDQTKNGTQIDQSYMTIGGGFGTVALGSTVAASLVLAVSAPSTGALGVFGGDSGEWVVKPGNSSVSGVAGGNIGGGDHMKARWVSPAMSGFKVGASYVPSTTNSGNMPVTGGTTGPETNQLDLGIQYSGKMGANAVKASATWWSNDAGTASTDSLALGASTTMGAFTVGLGWKDVKPAQTGVVGTATSLESETINGGVQWAQGATTLSVNYFKVEMPLAVADTGEDTLTKWTLGAKYAMGPGVDFLGTVQSVNWSDETAVTTDSNKGMAIVGGIKVAF
jgi:hypothetical protein